VFYIIGYFIKKLWDFNSDNMNNKQERNLIIITSVVYVLVFVLEIFLQN